MTESDGRRGLRIRCDTEIHPEVRRACLEYGRWLRKESDFPIRVVVYLKNVARIKNLYGELVVATFFAPFDKTVEPYIRVAVGDYNELLIERGNDNALAAYIRSISHELIHYDQWLNDLPFDEQKSNRKSKTMLRKYAETRERP